VFAQYRTRCKSCGMSSLSQNQSGKGKEHASASNTAFDGMSLSDVQRHLGLEVSTRQFRRYAEAGVFVPALVRKNKRGWLVMVNPPETKAAWDRLRNRIEGWRRQRYDRGWQSRPRRNPKRFFSDKQLSGQLTIQAIHIDFLRWLAKETSILETKHWEIRKARGVADLLLPMVELYRVCVSKIQAERQVKQQQ
jgi:hypothetical protein